MTLFSMPLFVKKMHTSNHDYLIWCGDFNMALNPTLHSFNYVSINNPKSRSFVNNFIEENNFVDLFRYYNPDKKRYTWHKKNPLK